MYHSINPNGDRNIYSILMCTDLIHYPTRMILAHRPTFLLSLPFRGHRIHFTMQNNRYILFHFFSGVKNANSVLLSVQWTRIRVEKMQSYRQIARILHLQENSSQTFGSQWFESARAFESHKTVSTEQNTPKGMKMLTQICYCDQNERIKALHKWALFKLFGRFNR